MLVIFIQTMVLFRDRNLQRAQIVSKAFKEKVNCLKIVAKVYPTRSSAKYPVVFYIITVKRKRTLNSAYVA